MRRYKVIQILSIFHIDKAYYHIMQEETQKNKKI